MRASLVRELRELVLSSWHFPIVITLVNESSILLISFSADGPEIAFSLSCDACCWAFGGLIRARGTGGTGGWWEKAAW